MLRLFVIVIASGLIVGVLAGMVASRRSARAKDAAPSGAAPSPSAWRAGSPYAPAVGRAASLRIVS